MRLRHNVTVLEAVRALQACVERSQQASPHGINDPQMCRHLYLNWVNTSQQQLRAVFSDSELQDSLLSRGYWRICSLSPEPLSHLLQRLISEELAFQVGHPGDRPPTGRFGEAIETLRTLIYQSDRPGTVCVLDTNSLLHYTRFDQIPWTTRMNESHVRLVIPLTVVDELDAKKYARRGEFQKRARELLTRIDGYVTASPPDGYSRIQKNTTIEILAHELGHSASQDNDKDILNQCEFLSQLTGHPVTLVTGDSGMRIRAQTAGLGVFKLTDDDLLPRHKKDTDEITSTDSSATSVPQLS